LSLRLRAQAIEVVRDHLCRTYPEEGCGVLIGTESDGVRVVERAEPVANADSDSRQRRYRIAPEQLLEVERGARARDWDVLGFFHSHPDHPAVPSSSDLESAWPYYSYLIVSVVDGSAVESRAWRLGSARAAFEPEALELLPEAGAP